MHVGTNVHGRNNVCDLRPLVWLYIWLANTGYTLVCTARCDLIVQNCLDEARRYPLLHGQEKGGQSEVAV